MLTNSNYHIESKKNDVTSQQHDYQKNRIALKWLIATKISAVLVVSVIAIVYITIQLDNSLQHTDKIITQYTNSIDTLPPVSTIQKENIKNLLVQYRQNVSTLKTTVNVAFAVLLLVTVVSMLIFYNILKHRLKEIVRYANDVASGDFNSEVDIFTNDEVGDMSLAVFKMGESLASAVNIANEKAEFAEQALSVSNNKSQLLVLQREELQRAKDAAEYSTKSKTQFVAQISHELRTPMNAIKGSLDMLQQTHVDEEQQRILRLAQGSSILLLRVINDVVDLSRIETGVVTIDEHCFDVTQQVHDTVELLSNVAVTKDVKFEINIDGELHTLIKTDSDRYAQILINLIIGLVEQTGSKHIQLSLSAETENSNSYSMLTKVYSPNSVFPDQQQKAILDMFGQNKNLYKNASQLVPIGLRICRHLIDLFNGKIGVCNDTNKSCYFWFKLKVSKVGQDDIQKTELEPGVQFNKRALFLCEDLQTTNSKICVETLQSWGIQTVVRKYCGDMIDLLATSEYKNSEFDMVVIDTDGVENLEDDLQRIFASIDESSHGMRKENLALVLLEGADRPGIFTNNKNVFHVSKPIVYSRLKNTVNLIFNSDVGIQNGALAPQSHIEYQNSRRILLVEDDEMNQQFSRLVLTRMGYEVEIACNGLEALQRVQVESFDLILMDCQMPEMDGFTATKEIRTRQKSGEIKDTPIVAMTANAMEGDREKCLMVGMDDYISKPINQHSLRRILQHWLNENHRTLKATR